MSGGSRTPLEVEVDSGRVVRLVLVIWISIELALVALDTLVNYGRMVPRISDISQFRQMANIAREDGIATWFSATQALLVAVALGLVAWRLFNTSGAKWRARGWALVSAFFGYLAFDDASKVHERVASGVKTLIRGPNDELPALWEWFPSYAWQLVFGPIFVGMALFMLVFFYREIRSNLLRFFVVAGLGCYALAVGLDFVEGIEGAYEEVSAWMGLSEAFAPHYGRVLEELLEMLGTTFFLAAFLGHFTRTCGPVDLRFEGRSPPPGA